MEVKRFATFSVNSSISLILFEFLRFGSTKEALLLRGILASFLINITDCVSIVSILMSSVDSCVKICRFNSEEKGTTLLVLCFCLFSWDLAIYLNDFYKSLRGRTNLPFVHFHTPKIAQKAANICKQTKYITKALSSVTNNLYVISV